MGYANPLLQSINSGEFSKRMEARVDFDRYPNAAKRLRNCLLYPQGGFTRRPGTRFVCEVADSEDDTILFPFRYSEEHSYQIEAGDGYLRFMRRQARIEVGDTNAVITNGTFTAGITGWTSLLDGVSSATIDATNTGGEGNETTFAAPLPSGIQSGDLLLLFVSVNDGSARTLSTPSGWTSMWNTTGPGNLRRFAGFRKTATGGEGSTVTLTASGDSDWATNAYRISGHTGTPESATATGTDSTPNPPSLTPSWGLARTLWLAVIGSADSANEVPTSAPSGFSSLLTVINDDTNTVTATASLADQVTTKNPGAFNSPSGSVTWAAATVAINALTTAAISWDSASGRMALAAVENSYSGAYQAVTVSEANKNTEHVLKFQVGGVTDGTVFVRVGTTSSGGEILEEIECGIGEHSIGFTPAATTFYVQFINRSSQRMFIDNVSLIDNAPMEVVSPYGPDDFAALRVYQGQNVVYLLHPDHRPRTLTRYGHRSWSLTDAFIQDGPYLSKNDGFDVNLKQAIKNPLFENGIVDWSDDSTGDAFIEHQDATHLAEMEPGTVDEGGNAVISTSAQVEVGAVHVVHFLIAGASPVSVVFGTSVGDGTYVNDSYAAGWHSVKFTASASTFAAQFSYNQHLHARAAIGALLVYPSSARLLEPNGKTGSVTVTASGFTPFTANDVGRLIRLTWPGQEPGYGEITGYTSSSVVTVQVVRAFANTAPTEDWNLGSWGIDRGFPTKLGKFDGRAIFANQALDPARMWGSQSGEPLNHRPDSYVEGGITVEDDDAISKALDGEQIDPIQWLNGKQQLIVGTASGQWIVNSNGPVITPADTSTKQHSATQGGDIKALAVEEITIYTDSSKRQLFEIGFKFDDNSFVSNDLTILADHILKSPVQELAYQRRPVSTVWARRLDGRLAALAYNRQHEVLGWTLSTIGGEFEGSNAVVESISVIPGYNDPDQFYPSDERDELWMIVKRTINGVTKRYVEFMEYMFDGPEREDYATEALWKAAVLLAQSDAFYVDCGLTYSGSPISVLTGLDHLEGLVVKVLGDGRYLGLKTVTGGSITLTGAFSTIHVGLGYSHQYESLKMAVGAQGGTSVNKVKALTGVGFIVLDCASFKATVVEYDEQSGRRMHPVQDVDFKKATDDPAAAIALFTGESGINLPSTGSSDPRVYAESDLPLPFTVIGIAPMVQTQEGMKARR